MVSGIFRGVTGAATAGSSGLRWAGLVRSMSSATTEKAMELDPGLTKSAVAGKTRPSEMSSAMKSYLKKKREHDLFIAKERSEFELGKKHLANMMGISYENMSQEDIDKAIKYLFPSGLLDPKAKPHMKPPEEIFPRQKEAEFDEQGRPFHPFYYTTKPNFFQSLYEIVDRIEDLTFKADRAAAHNWRPDESKLINTPVALSTTRWMKAAELSQQVFEGEKVTETMEEELVTALERMLENDWCYECKDLIFKYRTKVAQPRAAREIQEVQHDEQGRSYVEHFGQRKTSCARVRVTMPGSGRVRILHADYPEIESDLRYFFDAAERHVVMYPLQFTKLLGRVDLDCLVDGGGVTAQAGAIRYATAMALRSFVDPQVQTDMKVCGLLTQDIRVRERKKPGQRAARAKYTWKKR